MLESMLEFNQCLVIFIFLTFQSPLKKTAFRKATTSSAVSISFCQLTPVYSFFWVIPWRLNFMYRRFGTHCLFHLYWSCEQEGIKNNKPNIRSLVTSDSSTSCRCCKILQESYTCHPFPSCFQVGNSSQLCLCFRTVV